MHDAGAHQAVDFWARCRRGHSSRGAPRVGDVAVGRRFGGGGDLDLLGLEDVFRVADRGLRGLAGEGSANGAGGCPGTWFARGRCVCLRVILVDGAGGARMLELVAAAVVLTLEMIFLGEAGLGEAHQLVEDSEFKLQLDAVYHGLHGRFTHVIVGELQAYQDNVHANTDAVD